MNASVRCHPLRDRSTGVAARPPQWRKELLELLERILGGTAATNMRMVERASRLTSPGSAPAPLAEPVPLPPPAQRAGRPPVARPSSRIVAGTSRARTTVASTSSATSMPTPIILMNTIPEVAKAPMTTASSRAALVMIRPVRCRPIATAAVLSPVRSHSSRTRESRNTS